MSWSAQLEALDHAVLNAFPTPFQFSPQSGGGTQALTGTLVNPAIYEDQEPASTIGVSVIRLFVRFVDIIPAPQKGDLISIAGVSYDLFDVLADLAGGAVLKLRRKS